jgi:phytoene dehydrogenase-like protein
MKQENKIFDYVIVGAGWGGLSQAALHARDGKSVCLLEAYDRAGGYGHSFTKEGFSFCAEMQYLQGCQPGWMVHRFLKELGLEQVVEFNSFDQNCFDKVVIPGADFEIPLGVDNFERKLIERFPKEKEKIESYFHVMRKIVQEVNAFDEIVDVKKEIMSPLKNIDVIRYSMWTLQDFFDHLELSKPLQAILASQVGDVALGPKYVSMEAHADIVIGYGSSASFPKKGMGFFVNEIVKYVKKNGGEIHYNSRVAAINKKSERKFEVIIGNGKVFSAKRVISNIDPQKTFDLIANAELTPWFERKIKYKYSCSCISIFLGLKGVDLSKHGFGRWNVWHYGSQNIDKIIDTSSATHSYKQPFLFISTPSINTDPDEIAPRGGATMQIVSVADYAYFDALHSSSKAEYRKEIRRIEKEIIDYVEKNFVSKLRKHIAFKEFWSPIDLHQKVSTPVGNIYGEELSPSNLLFHRVSQETPIKNLYLVGATTGYPGLLGVITGSMQLYDKLKRRK